MLKERRWYFGVQNRNNQHAHHLQAIPKVTYKTGSVGVCRQTWEWDNVNSGENQNEKEPQNPYRLRR